MKPSKATLDVLEEINKDITAEVLHLLKLQEKLNKVSKKKTWTKTDIAFVNSVELHEIFEGGME